MQSFRILSIFLATACASVSLLQAADDLARLEQQSLNAAAEAVADSVVQIRTVGGLDRVDDQTAIQGPTTGLIVGEDGYIISSAFNFAQQPTSILVRLPDGEQRPAEIVGRDTSRMLVLLKVETDGDLPVPTAAPLADVRPGDWAIALGRTYSAEQVSISVGVVSALNRMQGRALQTDANVSATNYGGPLVDIYGRVLGVLVPMSPQSGTGETSAMAGSEFYDSGIGFAVPLEHVYEVLDRWKKENDLKRGLLGVSLKPGNPHATPPAITAVWPRSPAAKAGWKPDDVIVSIDGEPIDTQTDLRFQTATHYAGDELKVIIRRGEGDNAEELETRVTLADDLPAYQHAFLGVLPDRTVTREDDKAEEEDDENADSEVAGVKVRTVWPDSPADEAGIEPGDVITKLGDEAVKTASEAIAQLNARSPGEELAVHIARDEDELQLDVELAELPLKVLSSSDLPSTSDEDHGEGELKLEELKLPEMPQTARFYKPASDPSRPGLLIWLGGSGEESAKELAETWRRSLARDGIVLLMPEPASAAGWSSDDMEYLVRLLPTAIRRFNPDRSRIVIAGEGKAGQMAYAFAFAAKKLIRGVVTIDSPLPRTLELPENSANERLAILAIESPDTPMASLMRRDREKLAEAGYPVTHVTRREQRDGIAVIDSPTRSKVARWIDGLDRF
ncbi:MAG TPA: PDZ domain-containing protein [Lacipirellula sp.]